MKITDLTGHFHQFMSPQWPKILIISDVDVLAPAALMTYDMLLHSSREEVENSDFFAGYTLDGYAILNMRRSHYDE